MRTPQPKPQDPLIGTRIDGRYLITGLLGKGGMGVVYEGVHEQLGRKVAIKVLSSTIATEQVVVERFLREARVASGLGHGNIVDVSDLGHLQDGRPYLVMPKIQGTPFSDLLVQKGAQPPLRVLELVRGVAAALDLVHAKGLVHRDVKPENLMHVVREDGSETVMLMDFGIAMLISRDAVRLTSEGMVCGTPAYLAPETARGEHADHRADVYALATVTFELLTARLPFEADNPQRMLALKAFREPPSMNEVAGTQFDAAVEHVIARGLALQPEDRYLTAGAFVQALEIAINPSAALRVSTPTQQLAGPVAPERGPLTESSELPLGSSDSVALGQEQSGGAATSRLPHSDGWDRATVERVQTAKTPASSAPPATSSSPAPALPRARGGLIAVLSVLFVLLAGAVLVVTRNGGAPESAPAAPAQAHVEAEVTAPASPAATDAPSAQAEATEAPAPSDPSAGTPQAEPAPGMPEHRPLRSGAQPRARAKPEVNPEPAEPGPAAAPAQQQPALPTVDELNRQAGQAFMGGHLARAAELYQQATVRDPGNAAAFRGLALMSERLGRRDAAVRAYRRALQLVPTGAHAEAVRGRLQQLDAEVP